MKKYLFIAAALVMTLTSCQKETMMGAGSATDNLVNAISLKAANGMTKSAINGTTFPVGYDMLVSAYRNLDTSVAGDDVPGTFFEGIHFAKGASDAVWHAATPKYWPLTGNLDFLCIASSGLNTADNGIVPTCVWNAENAAKEVVVTVPDNSSAFDDILFGRANAQTFVATGNPVVFNHAEAAVVFTAKSNIAYNATNNVGITIDSIAVNGAKYSGTLTVTNPAAGATAVTDSVVAVWSNLGTQKDYVKARVWDSANLGTSVSESVLTGLNLTATSAALATKPFGEGYVILPEQEATPFTVYYTIHNGFKADGTTKLDNNLQYKYSPTSGTKWNQGKKYVYDINITLNEITIAPSVVDWANQTTVDVPINQAQPAE